MEQVIIKIDGMRCSMCEAHVNDLFRKRVPLKKVSSSYRKGETVIIGEGPYVDTELIAVLDGTGYRVLSVSVEPYQRRGLFHLRKE